MTAPLAVSLAGRDLLRISDLASPEAEAILDRAVELRAEPKQPLLAGTTLGLYFAKHSTRTRVSFSAGIAQLGGIAIPLTPDELQLSRGESIGDTALSQRAEASIGLYLYRGSVVSALRLATVPRPFWTSSQHGHRLSTCRCHGPRC